MVSVLYLCYIFFENGVNISYSLSSELVLAMVVVSLYWVFVLLFVSTTTAAPVDLTDEEVDPILVANKGR